MAKDLASALCQRLQCAAHCVREIEEEHDRQRQPVLAEVGDGLGYAVLE
jgi:hypothetical protein